MKKKYFTFIKLFKTILLTSILFMFGCGSKKQKFDEFIFKNLNKSRIWVEKVEGFSSSPPVGAMSSGSESSASFMDAVLSDECIILWNYAPDKIPTKFIKSKMSLKSFKDTNFDGLRFSFTVKGNWAVESFNY